MIKYFKELEKPNDQYLDLINERIRDQKSIDLPNLPLEFFIKYQNLFEQIKSWNLLLEDKEKKLYFDPESSYYCWNTFCYYN